MDTIYLLLEQINGLRSTLDAITFTAYFTPGEITAVVGFDQITNASAEIIRLSRELEVPKTPTA